MHRAVGAGPADDRLDLGMDPARDLGRRQRGEIAVLWQVERAQEALRDVGVGLAEIDIEHVRRHVAGDRQQGAFDALDLDAGETVQAHREAGEVGRAVARGLRRLARAEEIGGGAQEGALHGQFGPGGGIGAGGIGQIEKGEVQHQVGGRRRDPARRRGSRRTESGQENHPPHGGPPCGESRLKPAPDFSTQWKNFARFFHTMEKLCGIFPQCGKLFSTVWKNGRTVFHDVENCRR